jgi:FeS assembly SUF system protein
LPRLDAEVNRIMVSKNEIVTVLKDCYDPEIPINIWDLGLVYDISIDNENVGIKMTLTAPGCMMGGMIAEEVKAKVKAVSGVKDAKVELVWDPPWTPDRMSEEAKAQMGIA